MKKEASNTKITILRAFLISFAIGIIAKAAGGGIGKQLAEHRNQQQKQQAIEQVNSPAYTFSFSDSDHRFKLPCQILSSDIKESVVDRKNVKLTTKSADCSLKNDDLIIELSRMVAYSGDKPLAIFNQNASDTIIQSAVDVIKRRMKKEGIEDYDLKVGTKYACQVAGQSADCFEVEIVINGKKVHALSAIIYNQTVATTIQLTGDQEITRKTIQNM